MAEQTRRLPHSLHSTFISLRNPNFRVYFAAQIGSNIGSWIQITTENWLVLQLTDSGLALGITNAFQFGPLVFFGLYGLALWTGHWHTELSRHVYMELVPRAREFRHP